MRNNDLGCIAVPFILIAKLLEFIGKILLGVLFYIIYIPCKIVLLLVSIPVKIFTGEDISEKW